MHFNQKVAKNRGSSWKSKLITGKLDAMMNPTRLRLIRTKKGLSQDILASKLNIALSSYGAIERGIRPLKDDRAKKLSSILGKSKSYLFRKHGENKFIANS